MPACAYLPSAGTRLSADTLRHGGRQVTRMLHDRPAMAQFGPESEFFRGWAERKFAGEDLGTPIDWDPAPPQSSDAEHLAPAGDEHAAILVAAVYQSGPRQGRPRTFEELWAGAIYELHNVTFAPEFVRLNREADEGKLSKRAFIAGILKYEIRAAQQTRGFYLRVFLPWAEKKNLPTDPRSGSATGGTRRTRSSTAPATRRPIPGGRTRGRTIGPRSIAVGIKAASAGRCGCWKRCGPNKAIGTRKTTSSTGSTAVGSGSASRPPPKPANARPSRARQQTKDVKPVPPPHAGEKR